MSDKILALPARPAEQLHRPHAVARRRQARGGRPRPLYRRFLAAAHAACRVPAQPVRPRQDPRHRRERGQAPAGRRPGHDRRRAGQAVHRPLGRHADLLPRHEVGAAISAGRRPRLLGRRAGRHGGRPHPRRGRGCGRAHPGRMAGAAGRHRQGDRARSRDARAACRARRQPRLPQDHRHRRRRRGLRQGRPRHRGDLRVRPAHGRQPGAAHAAGRLRQGHAASSPSPPAASARTCSSTCSRTRSACPQHNVQVIAPDVGGSFGLKIHTYGDELAATAAAIQLGRPGQVRRRPPGIVRVRHSRAREPREGAHRREQVRRDRGLRHRRAVRRRRLFAIPAHQRVRGHPGAQHHRRSLPAQALPGARHRGLSEQGADLAVSRRRPPDRQYGRRASGRSGRLPARHRSDRDAPAQHHARRRLSRDQRQRHQAARTCRTSAASMPWSSA